MRFRAAVAAVLLAACSSSAKSSSGSSASVEYKAAAIDKQGPPSAETVRQYALVLDGLQEHCTDERIRLGDMAVFARDELAQRGTHLTLLEVLDQVARARASAEPAPCAATFTAVIFLP